MSRLADRARRRTPSWGGFEPSGSSPSRGIDAVNFGPGDPQYAHKDDEAAKVAALVRSDDEQRAFLEGGAQATRKG